MVVAGPTVKNSELIFVRADLTDEILSIVSPPSCIMEVPWVGGGCVCSKSIVWRIFVARGAVL